MINRRAWLHSPKYTQKLEKTNESFKVTGIYKFLVLNSRIKNAPSPGFAQNTKKYYLFEK
jgi:hypothetical protein